PTGVLPIVEEGMDSAVVAAAAAHPAQFYRVYIEGKPKTQSTELTTLVEKLADRLLGAGGELLTVVHGPACAPEAVDRLAEWNAKSHASVRLQCLSSRDTAVLGSMGAEGRPGSMTIPARSHAPLWPGTGCTRWPTCSGSSPAATSCPGRALGSESCRWGR